MGLERIIHDAGWTVGYITDVEGNLAFWTKYVDYSAVLYRGEDGQLLLRDKCQFVFGGDSCDRGCGDLQVIRDLVSLKSRFFDRVHLLMGNRDINKLRFPVAMSPVILSLKPGCYFTNHSADIALDDDFQLNDPVSKIKWILLHTMGSPFAFEYRRMELQREHLPASDADVCESFSSVVKEGGLMLRYLELAKVVVILGDVMFLHGAIHDFNQGFIPHCYRTHRAKRGSPMDCTDLPQDANFVEGFIVDDPFDWCEQINAFAASEIQDYKENIDAYIANLSAEVRARKFAVRSFLSENTDTSAFSDRDWAEVYSQHSGGAGPGRGGAETEVGVGIGGSLLHDEMSGYFHPQPGSALIQYGMGVLANKSSTRSVIYSSYISGGRPNPCSAQVAQWLLQPRRAPPSPSPTTESGESTTGNCGAAGTAGISAGAADGGSTVCFGMRCVRRVVVGHQPHADAPLVMLAHHLQIISADSSYSINTKWPASQLDALLLLPRDCATLPVQLPAISEDEEWLSVADYRARTPTAIGGDSPKSAHVTSGADSAAVLASADTRSADCISELLFCFPSLSHISDVAAVVDGSSIGFVQGVLSLGSAYSSTLGNPYANNALTAHISISGASPLQDPYIGREVKDGWFVKAAGVQLSCMAYRANIVTVSALRGEQENWYYLLAHSAGYNFRNKLVARDDICSHL